jgi:hypothetical protein
MFQPVQFGAQQRAGNLSRREYTLRLAAQVVVRR